MGCRVTVYGALPSKVGIGKSVIRRAAEFFAGRSSLRVGVPFREVGVVLQDDAASGDAHMAVMGAPGATDVITQRFDPLPGEAPGVYGELYVNCERAVSAAPRVRGWSAARELMLYVAHGMDHLSGADDATAPDRARMRRRELAWIRAFAAGARPGGQRA